MRCTTFHIWAEKTWLVYLQFKGFARMNRTQVTFGLIGLGLIIAAGVFFARGDGADPEYSPGSAQDTTDSQSLNENSGTATAGASDQLVLPENWESVTLADCAAFAPPVAIKQAASINPYGWTPQQLCAWMLANSESLHADLNAERQQRTTGFDAQFPSGAFDSPYRQFSDSDLELAAPNDGVASFVLATRLQHVDRERSDDLFVQSAKQTRLPGPLMAAVFSRDGVELVRDPASGTVAYADPEDVFKTAVLAMTVRHMGYDFQKADFFMEHAVMAMGPGATDAVLTESRNLYAEITTGGP